MRKNRLFVSVVPAVALALSIVGVIAAQEATPPTAPLFGDRDGIPKVTITEEGTGRYSLSSGDTRADLLITDTLLQYRVTKPGFWIEQQAEIEDLQTTGARVARLGDAWSVQILCRQPDRRIFVCTSFNRDGWDRPQEVGGVSMGGPSDSIDIRLSRDDAEKLLALIQPLIM